MSPVTQTPLPLSDEWATPDEIFVPLDAEFHFTVDAAAAPWNTRCAYFFSKHQDGLVHDWAGSVWLNPPYSAIETWLAKAYGEAKAGRATTVCLVPCTPDRHWWARYVEDKAEVRLLTRKHLRTGRVHFSKQDGTSGRAPFSSAILIYRARERTL